MSRQTQFTEKGVEVMSKDLTTRDLEIMRRWKSIMGQCPWCLYSGDLWSFATFNMRKRKGQTVSEANCRCPECRASVKRRTLVKIYEMTMDEYGLWFWDSVFTGGCYDKVQWDKLKARMRAGFTYKDCEPFWNQYRQHKEASLGGRQDEEDEENLMDYLSYAGTTLAEVFEEGAS